MTVGYRQQGQQVIFAGLELLESTDDDTTLETNMKPFSSLILRQHPEDLVALRYHLSDKQLI